MHCESSWVPCEASASHDKVIRIAECRVSNHVEMSTLFAQQMTRFRLVAAPGWRDLMELCEAFADVLVGEKKGQIVPVSLVE